MHIAGEPIIYASASRDILYMVMFVQQPDTILTIVVEIFLEAY